MQDNEIKYRTLFEQAPDAVVLIDPENGELVEVNTKAHEQLGYTRDEFKKLKIWDFEVLQSADDVKEHFNRILRDGFVAFETKHKAKSGEIKDIYVSAKSIDILGKKFITGIWHDNTEKKKMEENVRENETKYRTLFEQAADAILLIDPDTGEFVEFNTRAHELLGYTREEYKNLRIWDFEAIQSYDEIKAEFNKMLRNGFDMFETKHRAKDGTIKDILISAKPVDIRGKKFLQTIWKDITEQKKMAEKVQESEAKYRSIFEQAVDAIVLIDTESGEIVEFNNKTHEQLGYTREEFNGLKIPDFEAIQSADDVKAEFNKILKNGFDMFETKQRTKDGVIKDILVTSKPLVIRGKKFLTAIWRDITELKKMAEELQESETKYRTFFEQAADAIHLIDPESGEFVEFNTKAHELLGYIRNEYKKLKISDVELNENNALNEHTKKILSNGFETFETKHKTKDGEIKDVYVSAKCIDIRGKTFVQTISRDITEQKKMAEKLRESEIKYRTLFEQSVDTIILVDSESSELIEFNDKAHEQLGYTRDEFKKLKIPDFEVLQSPDKIKENLNKIVRDGSMAFETKQRTKTGEIKDIFVYARSINLRGKIFVLTLWHDITEQKKMEEKMQESEAKYRSIFEQAVDAIVLIDPESGELVEFNNKTHEQLGYTRDEFKVLKIPNFEAIQSADDVKAEFNKILRNGFDMFETKQRTKDGEIKDILVTSKSLDIRGKKYLTAIWRDITEQKKMAEKLQENETKYRTLFEQAADSVILIDPESGELVEFNDIAHRQLEYTRDEFKKLKIPDFEVLQSHDAVKEEFEKILRVGSDAFETKHRTKNGEIKDMYISTRSIIIRGKRFIQTIWHDITETKKAEKELKESEARYREAYEQIEFYKDLFAHDINNILQNIKSSLDLLLMWRNKPEKMDKINELMNIINDQLIRGSKLVSNIRKLSEIAEVGSRLEAIEAFQVLNEAVKFICKSYPDKNINIKIESKIKVINVKANQILLDVFENILFNGIRYNENKIIEIRTKISKEIKNSTKYVKFEFKDNGIGIPDVMKKRIFEGISTRKEKMHGMGLGLLLVRKVLSSYNGDIWVEDKVLGNPSLGSNFIILIPEVV